jgi:hypothetical protein
MQKIAALLAGVVLGFTGIALHNAISPIGLALALIVGWLGIWLVGKAYGSRTEKLVAAFGWFAVVYRAGTHGTSYELLIFGNNAGNTFLIAGFVGVLLIAVLPVR